VVAVRLALPRAVEKTIRAGLRILVEVMIPRRLTVAEAARAESGRK